MALAVDLVRSGAARFSNRTLVLFEDTSLTYKVPKRIEFVGTVPKSAVGKILRRALRDPLWAQQ